MSALQISIVFSNCVGFQNRPVDKKPCRLYRFQLYFQTVSAFKVVLSMKSHVGSTFFMSAPKPVDKCNSDFKFDCCRLQGTWVDWCWLHGFQSGLLSATRDLSLSIKKAKFSQKIRNFRKKKRNFRKKNRNFRIFRKSDPKKTETESWFEALL